MFYTESFWGLWVFCTITVLFVAQFVAAKRHLLVAEARDIKDEMLVPAIRAHFCGCSLAMAILINGLLAIFIASFEPFLWQGIIVQMSVATLTALDLNQRTRDDLGLAREANLARLTVEQQCQYFDGLVHSFFPDQGTGHVVVRLDGKEKGFRDFWYNENFPSLPVHAIDRMVLAVYFEKDDARVDVALPRVVKDITKKVLAAKRPPSKNIRTILSSLLARVRRA